MLCPHCRGMGSLELGPVMATFFANEELDGGDPDKEAVYLSDMLFEEGFVDNGLNALSMERSDEGLTFYFLEAQVDLRPENERDT